MPGRSTKSLAKMIDKLFVSFDENEAIRGSHVVDDLHGHGPGAGADFENVAGGLNTVRFSGRRSHRTLKRLRRHGRIASSSDKPRPLGSTAPVLLYAWRNCCQKTR